MLAERHDVAAGGNQAQRVYLIGEAEATTKHIVLHSVGVAQEGGNVASVGVLYAVKVKVGRATLAMRNAHVGIERERTMLPSEVTRNALVAIARACIYVKAVAI